LKSFVQKSEALDSLRKHELGMIFAKHQPEFKKLSDEFDASTAQALERQKLALQPSAAVIQNVKDAHRRFADLVAPNIPAYVKAIRAAVAAFDPSGKVHPSNAFVDGLTNVNKDEENDKVFGNDAAYIFHRDLNRLHDMRLNHHMDRAVENAVENAAFYKAYADQLESIANQYQQNRQSKNN
jgi:hypothetical protein